MNNFKQGDTVQIHDTYPPYYREEGIIQGIEGERVLIRLNSGEYTTCKQQCLILVNEGDDYKEPDYNEIRVGDRVRLTSPKWEGTEGTATKIYKDGLFGMMRANVEISPGHTADLPLNMLEPVLEPVLEPANNKTISGDGNNSSYYIVRVANPTDEKWEPYFAQCNDLIEALGMTFSEGEAFKAIWRRCRARQGYGKEGNSQRYDAEKVEFFGHRMVVQSSEFPTSND